MIIGDDLLGEGLRIKKDDHNWMVQEYSHTVNEKKIWKSKYFFSTLQGQRPGE